MCEPTIRECISQGHKRDPTRQPRVSPSTAASPQPASACAGSRAAHTKKHREENPRSCAEVRFSNQASPQLCCPQSVEGRQAQTVMPELLLSACCWALLPGAGRREEEKSSSARSPRLQRLSPYKWGWRGKGAPMGPRVTLQDLIRRRCLMGHKSWAILWQHFAAYVRKVVFWFVYSNVQHKTSSL